jgi:hypothetical protein
MPTQDPSLCTSFISAVSASFCGVIAALLTNISMNYFKKSETQNQVLLGIYPILILYIANCLNRIDFNDELLDESDINDSESYIKIKRIPKLPNFKEAVDLNLLEKEYFLPLTFLPLELDSINENLGFLSVIGVDNSEHFEYLQHQMALWAWKIYQINCKIQTKVKITEKDFPLIIGKKFSYLEQKYNEALKFKKLQTDDLLIL